MPYTAEELAQHMENDCMLVGWDEVPAMLRSQDKELARLRQALQEADNIMGHDDEQTAWRERWQHLWPWFGRTAKVSG
jgi:hypothetical protein